MNADISKKISMITESVGMQDVIRQYTDQKPRRESGRIPCPFHNGKNENLGFDRGRFHCFVCGEKGNQISFVAKLFGMNNFNAACKIDSDFNLGYFNRDLKFSENERVKRAMNDRKAEEARRSQIEKNYSVFCTALHVIEGIIQDHKGDVDEIAWACHKQTELEAGIEECLKEMESW